MKHSSANILAAIDTAPCLTTDGANLAREEFMALLRRDWAYRVLDAQAKSRESKPITPGYVGVTSKVDGARLGYWRVSVDGIRALQGDCRGMFSSSDAARHAAAEAVFPTLPEAVRAELGECP